MTSDLAAFLSARWDEAAVVYNHVGPDWSEVGRYLVPGFTEEFALADLAAKRQIVAAYVDALGVYWESYVPEAQTERLADSASDWLAALQQACRILAQPYRDHPDFRPEWRDTPEER